MLHLPVRQQGAQIGVPETLLFLLVAFGVESQRFVVDEAARPSELPQVAGWFAVWHQLEFEGLQSQHNSIRLLVYATVK